MATTMPGNTSSRPKRCLTSAWSDLGHDNVLGDTNQVVASQGLPHNIFNGLIENPPACGKAISQHHSLFYRIQGRPAVPDVLSGITLRERFVCASGNYRLRREHGRD